MEGWAKEYLTFPMRRQGELDGACGLYCILAVAAWWADRKALEFDEAPYLGAVPSARGFAKRLLGNDGPESGLDHKRRRRIAKACGLTLTPLDDRTRATILAHFTGCVGEPEPLIATLDMPFRDPLMRVEYDTPFCHSVVIVAVNDRGLVIADPHPWNERVSVWSWEAFEARIQPGVHSKKLCVERVVRRGAVRAASGG